MLLTVGYVAAGGAIGSSLRYLVNMAALRIAPGFPWGTLVINILGCAIMGGLATTLAMKGGQRFSPFLLTGVLGGFTTFSAFSLDAMRLWERGQVQAAIAYVGASVILSLLAVLAGAALAKGVLG
ncbi:fluoride efflux transporter CrcB [Falsirhodobacter sp. 20TX0035]|uniref:fluoride efflux transporter CrcB n=1 Tax=Falsirhodobacter sp. 20TX0035 TaxID=3022019 RepID=UPI00232F65A6|nr:fluoride efflux transporter CrcB [Falsirhodobacter sp. 20TX0035]MDB6454658.1 fluoride efflux transporter CrcB [Falsirhodobacter sp. 20TX0035]